MKQQYRQILSTPKPFVKWAGGKRQLIPILNENLPETFKIYYEPFLGGGALLFHMLKERKGQKCSISDINSDLILAYDVIQNDIDDLIYSLKHHEKIIKKTQSITIILLEKVIPKIKLKKHLDCSF